MDEVRVRRETAGSAQNLQRFILATIVHKPPIAHITSISRDHDSSDMAYLGENGMNKMPIPRIIAGTSCNARERRQEASL